MNDRELGEKLKRESWIAGLSFAKVLMGLPSCFWITFHCRPKSESRWNAFKFAAVFSVWYVELAAQR